MDWFQCFIVVSVGYLIGSLPFAVIIARFYGINIFEAGSGNPGATNVKRVLGRGPGNTVFALDFLKGVVAAGWPLLVWTRAPEEAQHALAICGIVGAIIGHMYSVFIGFKGGKGVATTMGGLLILMPWSLLIGIIVWNISFYTTRYVSLSSIIFGISLPISSAIISRSWTLTIFTIVLSVVVLFNHRSNIRRLIKGQENRFDSNKK